MSVGYRVLCAGIPFLSLNVKKAVMERYVPLAHQALKMNEFFDLRQNTSTLEEYYLKFVTLTRYAPKLSTGEQVTHFCQGLNAPLDTRLEAMRPSTLHDALIRAKPRAKPLAKATREP